MSFIHFWLSILVIFNCKSFESCDGEGLKTGESELLEFDLAQPEMGAIIETANTRIQEQGNTNVSYHLPKRINLN